MRAQPSSPFDISPMLKMYMESIELRKKNYENFLKSAPLGAEGIDGKKTEEFFTWMKTSALFPGSVAEIITHALEGVVRRVQETMRTTGMVKHGMVFNLSPEKLLEIFEDLSSKGMFLSLTKLRIKKDLTAIIGDETRASAVLEGTRPSTPWPEFLVWAGDRFVAADRAAAEKHSRGQIDVAAAVITPIILKMLGNHKVTDVPIELPYVDERSPIEGIIASPVNFKLHHRATPLIASAPKSAESFLTLNWIDIGLNGGTVFVKPDRAKLAEEFFSGIWPHIDGGSQQRIQSAAIVHKVTLPVPQLKAAPVWRDGGKGEQRFRIRPRERVSLNIGSRCIALI